MHISVRAAQSGVKHQYDRPTCVAFAVTAFHEYAHDVLKGLKKASEIDLSEEFLYYHCKQLDGLGPNSTGTTVSAASASLAANGQSLESLCQTRLFAGCARLFCSFGQFASRDRLAFFGTQLLTQCAGVLDCFLNPLLSHFLPSSCCQSNLDKAYPPP